MTIRWKGCVMASALLTLGAFAAIPDARAGVVFTSFNPGTTPTFDSTFAATDVAAGSSTVEAILQGGAVSTGIAFQAGLTSTILQFDLAIATDTTYGSDGNFTLQLWSSTGSGSTLALSKLLGSYNATAPSLGSAVNPKNYPAITTVVAGDKPQVNIGQYYFLVVRPTDANSFAAWYLNDQSPLLKGQLVQSLTANGVTTVSYVNNATENAFDVLGAAAVPEPSSIVLCCLALGVFAGSRVVSSRRRLAV